MKLTDWPALANQNTAIVAVEYHTPDRMQILEQFYHWGEEQSLSVFLWNPGYCELQQLIHHQGQYILQSTDRGNNKDIIQYLLSDYQPGIYLLEGVLQENNGSQISQKLSYQLLNAYHQALWSQQANYWVLLETYVQLPLELQPFIPVLSNPLPNQQQVELIVQQFFDCCSHSTLANGYPYSNTVSTNQALQLLIRACQGLPRGEINLLLKQCLGFADQLEDIAQLVLDHKVNKLRGRGLEYIAQPDIPSSAGLDLLATRLETITCLLQPEAQTYHLKFPTGMLLWARPSPCDINL